MAIIVSKNLPFNPMLGEEIAKAFNAQLEVGLDSVDLHGSTLKALRRCSTGVRISSSWLTCCSLCSVESDDGRRDGPNRIAFLRREGWTGGLAFAV